MVGELQSWAVDQSTPVGPQVYRSLRERIIHSGLEPGIFISEAEIARAFSISRQPVREAFIKLAEDGLVEIRPQRGTMVRKISVADVMNARFVREAVEADIVKVVVENADAALVQELRAQIANQRAVLVQAPEKFMQLDELFHRTLAEAADKERVWGMVNAVKAQMDRVRHLTLLDPTIINRAVEDHARIVEAVADSNMAEADNAMRHHLRMILRDLPEIVKAKPEYFETVDIQHNAA